jgi:hypothetical protein
MAEQEPVFVLRAQDQLAPVVIKIWALLAESLGASQEKVSEARLVAEDMEIWQLNNVRKIPD